MVSRRNQSSQVNVLPAMKHARTSSLPIIPTVPTINRARVMAKTRKLSRSMYFLSSAQCSSSFASHPTTAP
uniref:Uncharacterized protein n=1 Tax=Tanacetum cinerariifolium TaxID=118510 RepID=A0A699XMJ8_TANCI|nr:hypothetical protein [Tanacetum cinerariifolium]